jgi:hypothetical protein
MSEPLSEAVFDALLARAGLTDLSPAEREDIRQATKYMTTMAERLRTPQPPKYEDEPATVFAPWEARR